MPGQTDHPTAAAWHDPPQPCGFMHHGIASLHGISQQVDQHISRDYRQLQ